MDGTPAHKRTPPANPPSPVALSAAAAEARRRRTETLRQVAAGELDLDALILLASVDRAIARIRVKRAISALPGWGEKSADDACRWARIAPDRFLSFVASDAHPDRAERLRRVISLGPGHRPAMPEGWPLFGRLGWLEEEAELA